MTEVTGPAPAVHAVGLGKSYRRGQWALRNCGFAVPAGRVCGVVGPNGAGKSTLFGLMAHLFASSEGELRVFGEPAGTPALRARIGSVTQSRPLYPSFTVEETLRLGRELNPGWDEACAQRVIELGGLSPRARVGSLSGGQRSRVALALAMAKRPELLLLDEPMADLDPLARHDLMGLLLSDAAERGTTVMISSHLLAELDGAIDHVLLVQSGRVRLAGDLDEILDGHRLVTGLADAPRPPGDAVEWRVTGRQVTGLLRTDSPVPDAWEPSRPQLEQLLLGYLRNPDAPVPSAPSACEAAA
ncbi:ABC transporter ATP-binding protein [Kitasatospora griseola]|uniref:ABC transporter ATP-binding protein n=1 Tax=Kitasatospora griseola TaxID=2064 RepID=A0A0D0Q1L3_KITGR|nr:ABC transporter ATP-binding protein [Kitasatospora griseola]KIQ64848.1 ABC transporter ATP-binding protein [Kitasatospora griseola]